MGSGQWTGMNGVEVLGQANLEAAERDFFLRFPEYRATEELDRLRATEYGRLDAAGQVYLDYTGGGLYAESQVAEHMAMLKGGVFGNPHSHNPSSTAMTERLEAARRYAMQYFNADPGEYLLAFTANASGALKLVGEAFPFEAGGRLVLAFDNHNSVNGIREYGRRRGVAAEYAPLKMPALRLDRERLGGMLAEADPARENLFCFPAQSNVTGVKHPLELVDEARGNGWRVLLDAAAYVPASRLDLGKVKPDFVTVSFYKMFGYPTGVGALIARREAVARLRRPWFAGGTVNFASVQGRGHVLSPGEAAFEDGTLNYLSIPAVEIGLRWLERVGLERIGTRVRCLTGWLLEELMELRHSNGRALVRIYGPATMEGRGGTVTLNLYDPEGHLLDYRRVEELAGAEGISLRTGCFCNPGAGEMAEGLTEEDMLAAMALGEEANLMSFARMMQSRGHKSAGAIRVSVGLASNFRDAWRFREFVAGFLDQSRLSLGEVEFDVDSCRIIRDGA